MKKILAGLLFLPVLGIAQTGPGGVGATGTTVELWLDSRRVNSDNSNPTVGSDVSTWFDKSGNGVNVTATGAGVATYSASGLTFNNNGYMAGSDATFPVGGAARTAFVCAATPNTATDDVLFFYGTANNNQSYGILKLANEGVRNYFYTNDLDDVGGWTPVNSTKVISTWYQANAQRIYVNGTLSVTKAATPATVLGAQGLQIGGWNSFTLYSNATIAEVVLFSFALNNAQLIMVNNYLAAKYGLTLTANDIYTMDSPANGNFDNEVAGIGRVDAANIHNDSQGSAMVRILNPAGLGDNEYMIWGHDNGSLASTTTVNIPATVQRRLQRIWRVSETNAAGGAVDVGSVEIRWDLTGLGLVTATDLRLLVDTDGDGSFTDETPIGGAALVSGNVYAFTGITAITNGDRFTLATINSTQTPLPVELTSFEATQENENVILTWETASELNNNYFEVQRLAPADEWESLGQVPGAGTTAEATRYKYADDKPNGSLIYYKLKQVDFNGNFEYSPIRSVKITYRNTLFPNPTTGAVTISISDHKLKAAEIRVMNALGKTQTQEVTITEVSDHEVHLDLSKLPQGIYLIRTKTSSNIIIKQ